MGGRMKILLSGLFLFATTPVFAGHWDDRNTGDLVNLIDITGIPNGTKLPVYSINSAGTSEWVTVYYNSSNYNLGKANENKTWHFVNDSNLNILRSLGFIAGLTLVSIFGLSWNSRTV